MLTSPMVLIPLIVMTGLMAGIYFTFSVFIMKALALLPTGEGATAMNKINEEILKTLFLPLFFISSLWHAGLFIGSLIAFEGSTAWLVCCATLVYICGMFATTAFGNVPLNNMLKASEKDVSLLASTWSTYLKRWTQLNHIRTVSCTISMTLLVIAISNSTIF